MNYTENYQLPQWVATDRVLMADFNDAMAKTDAAIEKAAPFTLLRRATVAADTADFALNLSGLALNSYHAVELYFSLTATQNADVTMYLNNLEDSGYLNEVGMSADSLGYFSTTENFTCKGHIRLLTNQRGVAIQYFVFGSSAAASLSSCREINVSTLTSYRFVTNRGVIQTGSTFWVLGVKQAW